MRPRARDKPVERGKVESAFRRLDHPVMGAHSVPGPSFRLPEAPDCVRTAAPLLGQHNRDVLRGILGMTEEEVVDLEAEGALD